MPSPQDSHTSFFLAPVDHWRGAATAEVVSVDHCHTTHFCIFWSRKLTAAQFPVFLLLYPFTTDEFQFQSMGQTNPQQCLHWTSSKYLQQLVRNSCSTHILLGPALANGAHPSWPSSGTQPCTAPCTWQKGQGVGLTPRYLCLNCLCCMA